MSAAPPVAGSQEERAAPRGRGSVLVAAGILLSRIAGLLREAVIQPFLGLTGANDAFRAALRIPNLLQNLLGEGVLSASFIPVYSQLLEEGRKREADRLAGAVAGLLAAATGFLALVTLLFARPITRVWAVGLRGDSFELAVDLVRIMTVGIAFLVLAAWCLGVLNSHRRFFLSYASPVVWNAAQVAAVLAVAWRDWSPEGIAVALAWGVTAGGLLQFLVQLPTVRSLAPGIRVSVSARRPATRQVLARFGPAVLGRGVTQLSAFLDVVLVSLTASGGLAALATGQVLFLLPISLFAMSVAAAELPELSRLAGRSTASVAAQSEMALRRILFFVAFSSVAYVALGDLIVGLLYERGMFGSDDTLLVWFVLAAYSLGMPANAASRMLQNTVFALGDTKGPAQIALARIAFATLVTLLLMFNLDRLTVVDGTIRGWGELPGLFGPLPESVRAQEGLVRLGAVGAALGSASAAWVELFLLRRLARAHVGPGLDPLRPMALLGVPAALAFVTAAAVKFPLDAVPVLVAAPVALAVAGIVYTVVAFRSGVTESALVLRPARRLLWGRGGGRGSPGPGER